MGLWLLLPKFDFSDKNKSGKRTEKNSSDSRTGQSEFSGAKWDLSVLKEGENWDKNNPDDSEGGDEDSYVNSWEK